MVRTSLESSSRLLRSWVIVCVLLLTGPSSLLAAGRVFPIQDFEEVRDNWIGLETTVEGRRTVYDPTLIKLKNSTIFFKPQVDLPKIITRSSNIQLTGTLEKIDGKLMFQVREIKECPNDLEQFSARERQLKRNSASEWYDLANWGQRRGEFYKDSDLLEKAQESRRRGFDIERGQLPEKDPQARLALADRAAELDLPESIREELIHEAFIIRYKALQEKPDAQVEEQLLKDLKENLPGCSSPLAADDPGLRQRYLVSPDSVYAATKPADRPKLHRLLWSSLQLTHLERQLSADYQNGFEIAAKIDETVPEFHSRAETYREKMLQVRSSNVENMSRSEVLQLRQDYRDRKQPRLGDIAVEEWLQRKKKKLDSDDVEGLLSLADQYEELLNRRDTKQRMLMDAAILHPDSKEVIDRLTKMGFRQYKDKWITEEEFGKIPAGKLEMAMQRGLVEIGMTSSQVQKSMGVPASKTRVSSRLVVNEIWSYQNPGSQPIMVYLTRRLPNLEATVVGVDNVP